jgi:hypothetical protein
MLDLSDERDLIDDFWESTSAQARLPVPEQEYCAQRGAMPSAPESKRVYHRYYLRGKALIKRRGALLGIYTKDVSRQGIGFLSPMQLLPKERIYMRLPGASEILLEVTRCLRIDEGCFESGARFISTSKRVTETQGNVHAVYSRHHEPAGGRRS